MVHGDDQGLILPPRLAPVPGRSSCRSTAATKNVRSCSTRRTSWHAELSDYRVRIDKRDGHSPGFKFNDWEMRGVPLRIELGPRDIADGEIVLARRDIPGRDGKQPVPREAPRPRLWPSCSTRSSRRSTTAPCASARTTPPSPQLRRVQGGRRARLRARLVVRGGRLRGRDQGSDRRHLALHPPRPARRQRCLHPRRSPGDAQGDLRAFVLSLPRRLTNREKYRHRVLSS